MRKKIGTRIGQRGTAVVEISLLIPWIFLLFAGVLDFGFYGYALIATQNAARAAALVTSAFPDAAADDEAACIFVLGEMAALPNAKSVTRPCPTSERQITDTKPVAVDASAVTGADGEPASQVTVVYRTIPLVPLPFMTGRMTITRVVVMRIGEG